jgi:hypothetical protein
MTPDELKSRLKGKMMYRARLLTQSLRRNLIARDHVLTGKLHDSIKSRTMMTSDGRLKLQVSMYRYGDYINKRTDLRPKWKPPFKAIYEWAKEKGLEPSQEMKKRKDPFSSMVHAISNHMKNKGFMYEDSKKNKVGWLRESMGLAEREFATNFANDFAGDVERFIETRFRNF